MAEEQPEIPCPDHNAHLSEPDESCKDFIMQQTMLRIKDPKRSLDFYSRVLGMRLVLYLISACAYWRAGRAVCPFPLAGC